MNIEWLIFVKLKVERIINDKDYVKFWITHLYLWLYVSNKDLPNKVKNGLKCAKDKRRQKADISIIDITAYDRTPRYTNLHQSQQNVKRDIDYWLNYCSFSRKKWSKTKDMNENVLSEKVQNGSESAEEKPEHTTNFSVIDITANDRTPHYISMPSLLIVPSIEYRMFLQHTCTQSMFIRNTYLRNTTWNNNELLKK